jgi:DNA polymerase-3 subunit chi
LFAAVPPQSQFGGRGGIVTRVDFYHLTASDVATALVQIAGKVLQSGQRLLIVEEDAQRRDALSQGLWSRDPVAFLANGVAGGAHDARQPVLIAPACDAANGAQLIALADGTWRDAALSAERVLLFFAEEHRAGAREAWKTLGAREDVTRHYWKQENGRWVEGP